jgi:hypothetical protein
LQKGVCAWPKLSFSTLSRAPALASPPSYTHSGNRRMGAARRSY